MCVYIGHNWGPVGESSSLGAWTRAVALSRFSQTLTNSDAKQLNSPGPLFVLVFAQKIPLRRAVRRELSSWRAARAARLGLGTWPFRSTVVVAAVSGAEKQKFYLHK